jgi:23S rRNA (uracil1939-C5)-methyltransferase
MLDRPIGAQLEQKAERLRQGLGPLLAGIPVDHDVPRQAPVHHRTKLLYPVRPDARGAAQVGIYARGSHDLVRILECRTQDPALTELGLRVERILRELDLVPYDETNGRGFVRAIAARIAPGTGELLFGIVTTGGLFPQSAEFAERVRAAARILPPGPAGRPRLVGVLRSLHDRPGNFLLGSRHVPLAGRDHQIDRAGALELRVSFGSFYQVHRDADRLLYRAGLAMAGDLRGRHVVDAYGGVGGFGLRAAAAGARSVRIVEDHPQASRDAKHNAERNRLAQVAVLPVAFAEAALEPPIDLLIADPPRSGLQEAGVARVLAAAPPRLLLVSCALEAAVRDVRALAAGGYAPAAVRIADLFPHTDHCESLILLERRGSAGIGTRPR